MTICIRCEKEISEEGGCDILKFKITIGTKIVWNKSFSLCSTCIDFLETFGSTEKILRNIAKNLVM